MIPFSFLCCFCLALEPRYSLGVGIKRRLQEQGAIEGSSSLGSASSSSVAPPPVPSGGIRRRLEGHHDAAVGKPADGPLYISLKNDWAKGKINSLQVQEYAFGASAQGAAGLEGMAKLGNSGQNPQNILRALKNLLGTPEGAPEFSWCEIPMKKCAKVAHPFLMPHEFFASFRASCPDAFQRSILGPANAAFEFWRSIQHSVFVKKHPSLLRSEWHRTVPIGLHGDGGAFSKQDSLYVLSWNSLLGLGSTVRKRFLFTVVRKSDMTPQTLDTIFKILAWSLNTLLVGKTPLHDWLGRPTQGGGGVLASGLKAAMCQIRGIQKPCYSS